MCTSYVSTNYMQRIDQENKQAIKESTCAVDYDQWQKLRENAATLRRELKTVESELHGIEKATPCLPFKLVHTILRHILKDKPLLLILTYYYDVCEWCNIDYILIGNPIVLPSNRLQLVYEHPYSVQCFNIPLAFVDEMTWIYSSTERERFVRFIQSSVNLYSTDSEDSADKEQHQLEAESVLQMVEDYPKSYLLLVKTKPYCCETSNGETLCTQCIRIPSCVFVCAVSPSDDNNNNNTGQVMTHSEFIERLFTTFVNQ